jgi:hypothetical protein
MESRQKEDDRLAHLMEDIAREHYTLVYADGSQPSPAYRPGTRPHPREQESYLSQALPLPGEDLSTRQSTR